VVFIAGDTISYGELADVVKEVRAKTTEREEWTVQQLSEDLSKDSENGIKKYRVVFAEGKGVSWKKEMSFNVQKDIKLQTVRDWLLNSKT